MFYHITSEDALNDILKNGLVPQIGANAQKVNEREKMIYLCFLEDVPYWRILLNKTNAVLLSVDIDLPEENTFNYGSYSETSCKKTISPEKIKVATWPYQKVKHMRELCNDYLYIISYVTEVMARYYTGNPCRYTMGEVKESITKVLAVLPNLDYTMMERADIRKALRNAGIEECAFTFVDYYLDTKNRLYEMLIQYPEDELTPLRKRLYRYIKQNFSGCLGVKTGGWTN